ncbi:MAG: DUF397 domain-containing protein [Candidatus Dormibacteria bacterium]
MSVEIGRWVKSSRSESVNDCVQVMKLTGGGRSVRNSKDPGGPVVTFTESEWSAFLGGAKDGEFDG